jgi:para-nitrobenzyl esterase
MCFKPPPDQATAKQRSWGDMLKLSELRSARLRANKLKPTVKAGASIALGLFITVGALTAPMQARAASPLRVETKEGPVKGFLKDGVAEFLGIPYAEPPIGKLRWMPPKNHAPWTKVLQATTFGPQCLQVRLSARLRVLRTLMKIAFI